MLNMQDEKDGWIIMAQVRFNDNLYEIAHNPNERERAYVTYGVSDKRPAEHIWRRYFYTIEGALADLQQRTEEAMRERFIELAAQNHIGGVAL